METESERRQRHMTVILGTNGMGKTELLMEFYRQWLEANPGGDVFAIHKRGQFNGYWPTDYKNRLKQLYAYIEKVTNYGRGPIGQGPWPMVSPKGALLILDDMDGWCPQATAGTIMDELWTEHRHQRLDVFVTAHRTQTISKTLIGCCHYLYLFNTEEPNTQEYLGRLESLKQARLEGIQEPKTVGQCIEIVKDPGNPSKVRATFRNFYNPAKDTNRNR